MKRVSWRRAGIVGLLLVLLAGGLFWAANSARRGAPLDLVARQKEGGRNVGASGNEAHADEYVTVGGVRRRRSDVAPSSELARQRRPLGEQRPRDYGKLPPVAADENVQVKAVAAALASDSHPERFSALIRPAAFDMDAFKADPASYLNTVEPGRVFQPAQPGPGVPKLYPGSPPRQQVRQGTKAKLRVAVPPGAPVTFTSFDAGAFSNKLTSITVQADANGTAEADFTATSGTIADIHILASSPVASGRARFVVNVLRPDGTAPY